MKAGPGLVRVLVAGIVGGILMFVWGAVSHMVLQVGDMALKSMPESSEPAVLEALESASLEPGVYFYPGWGDTHASQFTPEQEAAWLRKLAAGPRGLILYNKGTGREVMMEPSQLGGELASNIVAALLVAFIFAMGRMSFARMVLASILIGIVVPVSVSFSHWNWYGFPGGWFTAECVDQVVGWAVSGVGIALVLSRGRSGSKSEAS